MKTDFLVFKDLQNKLSKDKDNLPLGSLHEASGLRHDSYINEYQLFIAKFNALPNYIKEENINCKNADKWFRGFYVNEIQDFYFSKSPSHISAQSEISEIFYFLDTDLIVIFNFNYSSVKLLFRHTEVEKVEDIIKKLKKYKHTKSENTRHISVITSLNSGGLITENLKLEKTRLDIESNYNSDFAAIHQVILQKLSKRNEKGLVLLHGKPGTGKTTYIKYLVSKIKKEVVFLPPSMANAVTNPDLLSVLIESPNAVFVVEDAETIIESREQNGISPVSALLNLTDGLLSDALKIQIICTFNTSLSKVDSALLRRGRLIAKYEFKELETQKAKELSTKLGFKTEINNPMTLADIYNQSSLGFGVPSPKKSIGFIK